MKKKVLAMALAITVVMSFIGCGSTGGQEAAEKPDADTESEAETEQGKENEAEEKPDEEAGSETDDEAGDETSALVPISFRLNYTAAGLHAPFYYALEKGYYEEVGLDVTIGEGTGSGTTAKLVGTGDDELGLVDSGSVASAIANEIPLKIVCPIYAVNGFAAISMKDSGIESPKDLEGKKIGITTGDAPSNLFAALEAANDIDDGTIKYVTMDAGAKVTSLVNGDVDAILAGADDQAITLQNMGHEVNVMRYSDYGAATVGLSIVASEKMIAENSDVIEKFIAASMKAWDECRTDNKEAIDIFMNKYPTLDRANAEGSLGVALDSLFAQDSKTLGDVSEDDWISCRDMLVNYLGVDESIQPEDIYTYDCLPSELPAK